MTLYLPDAHAVVWHEFGDPKLSATATRAFAEAAAGRAQLIAHPVVLAEFYWLLRKAKLEARFLPYVRFVSGHPAYRFEPVTLEDVQRLDDFDEVPEMHDRLIAITAERIGATLITRDSQIQASPKVRWAW